MAFEFSEVFGRLLLVLLAFSGYPAGHVLANLASEEVKDGAGQRWFKILRGCALASLVLILLFYSLQYQVLFAPFILIAGFLFLTIKQVRKQKEFIGYFLVFLSLILAIMQEDKGLNFLFASSIFIYLTASVAVTRGILGK